jgi:hypothetical protein
MTGFDHAACYPALGVPEEEYRVEAAIAIGRQGDRDVLPQSHREREGPTDRDPISQLVFQGRFQA